MTGGTTGGRERTVGAVRALSRFGRFESVTYSSLMPGDIIANHASASCVVRIVDRTTFILRSVLTQSVQTVRVTPEFGVSRLNLLPPHGWVPALGDVLTAGGGSVALVREERGWVGTRAPWTPLTDVEVLLGVSESRMRIIRSRTLSSRAKVPPFFSTGAIVATADHEDRHPMVLLRPERDWWTTSVRGLILSDLMVRDGLERGSYHLLRASQSMA